MKKRLKYLMFSLVIISLIFSISALNNTTSINATLPINNTNITSISNFTNMTITINQTRNYSNEILLNQTNYTIPASNISNYNLSNFSILINDSNINFSITQNGSNFTLVNISIEKAILKADYIEQIREIKLDKEFGRLVYLISGIKKGKLFAIVPVSAKVEQKIDANSGTVISTEKPWWSFLATKI